MFRKEFVHKLCSRDQRKTPAKITESTVIVKIFLLHENNTRNILEIISTTTVKILLVILV